MKKLLFLIVALLSVTAVSFGQSTNQGDVRFEATIFSGQPLTVTVNSDAVWAELRPGVSYKCIADFPVSTTNITPIDINNQETFEPAEIEVLGTAGSQVVCTFILPSALNPTAGIGRIDMTYDNQSASWLDETAGSMNFFNPTTPFTVTLDYASQHALLYLGGNPSVSADATYGDVFEGYALMTAEYVGM